MISCQLPVLEIKIFFQRIRQNDSAFTDEFAFVFDKHSRNYYYHLPFKTAEEMQAYIYANNEDESINRAIKNL
jgi:hypothetical protein